MAGIGFDLRSLDRSEWLSLRTVGAAYAIWIASGPFVLATMTLAGVRWVTQSWMTTSDQQHFKAIVIYGFMISLVSSAGTALAGARLAADAIYSRTRGSASQHLIGALIAGSISSALISSLVFGLLSRLPMDLYLAAIAFTVASSWLWTSGTFAGAVREHRLVARAFIAGLATMGVLAALVARLEPATGVLLQVVTSGVLVTVVSLLSHLLAAFGGIVHSPATIMRATIAVWTSFPTLAAGGFLAAAGAWSDRWVVWASQLSTEAAAGLRHAPVYDFAMLGAFVIILPLLAQFLVHREADLYILLRRFFSCVLGHRPLAEIEAVRAELAATFRRSILRLILSQLMIVLLAIMLLPWAAERSLVSFGQISILRYVLLGSVFHLCFLASSSVLLLTDARGRYAALQGAFVVVNVAATASSLWLGPGAIGLGYLVACLVCGPLAFWLADDELENLVYLTFRRSLVVGSRRHAEV